MAVSKNLTLIFMCFYLGVIIYLMLFFLVPDIQIAIINGRNEMASLTEGENYFWALLIAFIICFIGSASIGFPIPFPFVMFSLSNSVYIRYRNAGLVLNEILMSVPFWLEITGIAIAGGLGCALGELTSFFLGKGAKKLIEHKESKTLENLQGFGRLVLENPKHMYSYIFIAAALPIPDDPLWIALGMTEKKINIFRCILSGWAGKTITTMFYVILPILFSLGITAIGAETDDISSVVTEAIMMLVTLSMMFLIFAFDWNKFIENRKTSKADNES
jgi:membrane protein YqaA with SNARE-associated domain